MEIRVKDRGRWLEVQLGSPEDFDLGHIFECGQCFRWDQEADGSYTGVAFGKAVNMAMREGCLQIRNSSEREFWNLWHDYLDLGRDYGAIKNAISASDPVMQAAVAHGYGIRLLNQESWETLISFIISQNRNIPAIKRSIEMICERWGTYLGDFMGRARYSFPRPEALAGLTLEALMETKVGYRAPYILSAAKKIVGEDFELEKLKGMNTSEARENLLVFHGVGPKVADCILLFGLAKYDVFPTDVWIRRIVETLYHGKPVCAKAVTEFSCAKFGAFSGFAQQYLFFYAKAQGIGK